MAELDTDQSEVISYTVIYIARAKLSVSLTRSKSKCSLRHKRIEVFFVTSEAKWSFLHKRNNLLPSSCDTKFLDEVGIEFIRVWHCLKWKHLAVQIKEFKGRGASQTDHTLIGLQVTESSAASYKKNTQKSFLTYLLIQIINKLYDDFDIP